MQGASAATAPATGVLNLPNVISLGRIAVAPVLVWLLTDPGPVAGAIGGVVFVVASLSDWLDGYLARTRGLTTRLGKFLDPLADKVLVISPLVMLAAMPEGPRVPAWMVAALAARELAVTGLRTIALGEGLVLGAESLGKVKMTFEVIAVTALIVRYRHWLVDFHAAGMVFLWIALLLALWSAGSYVARLFRVLQETPA